MGRKLHRLKNRNSVLRYTGSEQRGLGGGSPLSGLISATHPIGQIKDDATIGEHVPTCNHVVNFSNQMTDPNWSVSSFDVIVRPNIRSSHVTLSLFLRLEIL